MMPTVIHHSMGGGVRGLHAVSEAGSRQPLIGVCGRVVAVAAPGASSIDLFDAADVSELSAVLGAGAVKMRFIASFPVSDIADAISVHALVFLRGGLLVVGGVCSRGSRALPRSAHRDARLIYPFNCSLPPVTSHPRILPQ